MQMPNDDFSVEKLVCNDSFQQYCLGSDLINRKLWDEWILSRPEKASEIEEARNIVMLLTAKQGSRIQQLTALSSGIDQHDVFIDRIASSTVNVRQVYPVKTNKLYQYLAGAAVAAIIILSFILFFQKRLSVKDLFSRNIPGKSISSGMATRKTVILPDGTLITMGKESTIRLKQNFSTGNRELWLSGEAFFDVKHDREHPFVVHTVSSDIQVLGTVFNVKAYPGDMTMETTMIRGSVRVDAKKYTNYSITLKPDEKLISYNHPGGKQDINRSFYSILPVKNSSAGTGKPDEIKWVRNRLDIEDEPLSVIAQKLQQWYGITIVVTDDEVKNYHYSGVFENENVVKTLEALQLSYPFEFKISQEKITISKSK